MKLLSYVGLFVGFLLLASGCSSYTPEDNFDRSCRTALVVYNDAIKLRQRGQLTPEQFTAVDDVYDQIVEQCANPPDFSQPAATISVERLSALLTTLEERLAK